MADFSLIWGALHAARDIANFIHTLLKASRGGGGVKGRWVGTFVAAGALGAFSQSSTIFTVSNPIHVNS